MSYSFVVMVTLPDGRKALAKNGKGHIAMTFEDARVLCDQIEADKLARIHAKSEIFVHSYPIVDIFEE